MDVLVGRERETAAMSRLLAGLAQGRGRLVLLVGEPGIGKTRLAQELAGLALAAGTAVVWGRCLEDEGAPPYWPWRQVVKSLGHDPALLSGEVESPEERFRLLDTVQDVVHAAAPVAVVLEDLHAADEASLALLRHLADGLATQPVLLLATTRTVAPALDEALRGPAAERWDLRRLDLAEVERLTSPVHAVEVHRTTDGNPMFVREVARALEEGTWDPQRLPRSVVDAVAARLQRTSPATRAFLQTAAVAGRELDLEVLALASGTGVDTLLPHVDAAGGFLEGLRFAHALTRDAVVLSLSEAERRDLHARVGAAVAQHHAADLADHCADLLRHAQAAGDLEGTRRWAAAAGQEAGRRLAFDEAVRLCRVALAVDPRDVAVLHQVARFAYYAGDLATWLDAVERAAGEARDRDDAALLAETALLLEAAPDPRVTALAEQLSLEALPSSSGAVRARLLALLSQVAYYAGEPALTEQRSAEAVALAREVRDDVALAAALRARWEALAGPVHREDRLALADELLAAATRISSPRNEMWARIWRVEALTEAGRFREAAAALPSLAAVCDRVGGPLAAWHRDRVSACIAQAQARYVEAAELAQRGFERMSQVEQAPARGAWFALQAALASHVGATEAALFVARLDFEPPPQFVTMGRLSRAFLLSGAGFVDEARAPYLQTGPPASWSLPVFFVLPGRVVGTLSALRLGLLDDVAVLVPMLEELRDEHAVGGGVSYLGPVTLTLGRAYAALGRSDDAVRALESAVTSAEEAGAPGFAAEARHHLAQLTGDAGTARQAADAIRALGMTAYAPPATDSPLSPRELEVAALVAEGLTNKQIAERLFLSERTAQNHVQHILTKLDLSNRAQVAAWWMSR